MSEAQRSAANRRCLTGLVLAGLMPAASAEGCAVLTGLADRPAEAPVVVDVTLKISEFREINESDGSFTADFETVFSWTDPRLSAAFATADDICPEALDSLWSPEMQIANFVSVLDQPAPYREVGEDGRVVEWRRYVATLTAAFDLAQFPFDKQTLHIRMQSRRNRPADLDMRFALDPEADVPETSGWTVGPITADLAPRRFGSAINAPEVAGLDVNIPITRLWFWPVINIYLPNLGCTLVALSVYFLPIDDGGNRIAISSTAMLIAAAFAFVMSDYITGSLSPIELFFWASVLIPFVTFAAALISIPLVAQGWEQTVRRMDRALLIASTAAFVWVTIYVWLRP
jgi:hypothetical protein